MPDRVPVVGDGDGDERPGGRRRSPRVVARNGPAPGARSRRAAPGRSTAMPTPTNTVPCTCELDGWERPSGLHGRTSRRRAGQVRRNGRSRASARQSTRLAEAARRSGCREVTVGRSSTGWCHGRGEDAGDRVRDRRILRAAGPRPGRLTSARRRPGGRRCPPESGPASRPRRRHVPARPPASPGDAHPRRADESVASAPALLDPEQDDRVVAPAPGVGEGVDVDRDEFARTGR